MQVHAPVVHLLELLGERFDIAYIMSNKRPRAQGTRQRKRGSHLGRSKKNLDRLAQGQREADGAWPSVGRTSARRLSSIAVLGDDVAARPGARRGLIHMLNATDGPPQALSM
jgi:hypothetical protein